MLVIREHYADFGPTLACEMLREHHDLMLSKETVRRLMIEAGLWTLRSERHPGLHQPRERRACLAELIQIDGSRHAWFEKRREPCSVLVFIEDATGRILYLHFSETECTNAYFEALQAYLPVHGKPRAFYPKGSCAGAMCNSVHNGRNAACWVEFQKALTGFRCHV